MADPEPLPIIAVVTAYNEAETIGEIVRVLVSHRDLAGVHVVDDASTDKTADIARSAGADVTTLARRVPVGEAIRSHLEAVQRPCHFFWCDADLTGLTDKHVSMLIERYRRGDVSQVMSGRAVPPNLPRILQTGPVRWFWCYFFGPISGERMMSRDDFATAMTAADQLGWRELTRGYGIVLFLNCFFRRHGAGQAIVYLPGLRQRQKYQKWGRSAGLLMVRQWLEFIRVWIKIRLFAPRTFSRAEAAPNWPNNQGKDQPRSGAASKPM